MNAGQFADGIRGNYHTGEKPSFPEAIDGEPPIAPNVYTDGGVKYPNKNNWQLGGFGLWVPDASGPTRSQQQQQEHLYF